MKCSRPTRAGVALLDAIVATIIMGVALALIIGLGGSAISAQTQGEQIQTAAMLADEQLELVLATGVDSTSAALPTSGTCDAPFEKYRYALSITPGSDSQPSIVKVTITWDTLTGPRSIDVETRIATRPSVDQNPQDRAPTEIIQRGPGL